MGDRLERDFQAHIYYLNLMSTSPDWGLPPPQHAVDYMHAT